MVKQPKLFPYGLNEEGQTEKCNINQICWEEMKALNLYTNSMIIVNQREKDWEAWKEMRRWRIERTFFFIPNYYL